MILELAFDLLAQQFFPYGDLVAYKFCILNDKAVIYLINNFKKCALTIDFSYSACLMRFCTNDLRYNYALVVNIKSKE